MTLFNQRGELKMLSSMTKWLLENKGQIAISRESKEEISISISCQVYPDKILSVKKRIATRCAEDSKVDLVQLVLDECFDELERAKN